MSDFYQTGLVTTLHRLGAQTIGALEEQVEYFAQQKPIALVLPALYSEFERPAMDGILRELANVNFVKQFVLSAARTTEEQLRDVMKRLSVLGGNVRVLWHDGPRIRHLYKTLEENGLNVGPDGKGRQCWMAYGYVIASREADVIALHDCDIVNYSRDLLARLCFPVVHPGIDIEFCKGYYARASGSRAGSDRWLAPLPPVSR
jgi:glucosyl-3-phosphoglycerate synthase